MPLFDPRLLSQRFPSCRLPNVPVIRIPFEVAGICAVPLLALNARVPADPVNSEIAPAAM